MNVLLIVEAGLPYHPDSSDRLMSLWWEAEQWFCGSQEPLLGLTFPLVSERGSREKIAEVDGGNRGDRKSQWYLVVFGAVWCCAEACAHISLQSSALWSLALAHAGVPSEAFLLY